MKASIRIGLLLLLAAGAARASSIVYLAFDGYSGTIGGQLRTVQAFDAANLDADFTEADEAAIEQRIFNIVHDAFADFRVFVTTSAPGAENHMVIGIGSDANGTQFGFTPTVDSDPYDMDWARVYAGSFKQYDAFQGIHSTVQRWGNAIGETTAHEAGHNYGLNHWQATPTPGEQALGVLASDHLMATSPTIDEWQRANNGRVFGDLSYGAMAATIGLKMTLLYNGSWTNHNQQAAQDLHVIVLTTSDSMTLKEWGGLNPFTDCEIVSLGTEQFGGQTYNKYRVDFSGGQVASGAAITTTVSTDEQFQIWPDPEVLPTTEWLVRDAYFTDGQGNAMPVRPRNISIQEHYYLDSGEFTLGFRNDTDRPMQLNNLNILLNHQRIDLAEMNYGAIPTGTGAWLPLVLTVTLAPGQSIEVVLGDYDDWVAGPFGPGEGGGGGGGDYGSEGGDCSEADESVFRGMFPSCYWTAEAEVTTFGVDIWDPQLQQYVIADVTEQWVWQSAGLAVPEPAVLALLAAGGLLLRRRRC